MKCLFLFQMFRRRRSIWCWPWIGNCDRRTWNRADTWNENKNDKNSEKRIKEKTTHAGHNRHTDRELWWLRICQMKNKILLWISKLIKSQKDTTIYESNFIWIGQLRSFAPLWILFILHFIVFCDFVSFFTHHFLFLVFGIAIRTHWFNAHILYRVCVVSVS